MTLVKYKEPTKYCFYEWVTKYPTGEFWMSRIKESPESKLNALITNRFYKFVKTACKNCNKEWLNWDILKIKIKKEIPILNTNDLKKLKEVFDSLVTLNDTVIRKQGLNIENLGDIKKGYCIEKEYKDGAFCEKEILINSKKSTKLVHRKSKKDGG